MNGLGLPYLGVLAILLLGTAQKLVELWSRRDDPLRRTACACLASLAAATAVQLFSDAIDERTGVPYLGGMLSDVSAMTAAYAGRLFLTHVNYPAPLVRGLGRRRFLGWSAAVAAYVILYLAFPLGSTADGHEPIAYYAYIWYAAITLVSIYHLGLRYARLTDRPPLRLGLRIISAGSVCGLVFQALHAVMLISDGLGRPLDQWDDTVALPLELLTESLLLVGVTIPAWGARLTVLARRIRDRRSYRLLHPLWLALYGADPELTLVAPEMTKRRHRLRDIEFLLYRQVIEIRDGQLALRAYADADVVRAATDLGRQAGLSDEDVWAVGEAAAVAAGIAAKAHGRRPSAVAAEPGPVPGGADITTEIAWLTRVARAFTRSPLVAGAAVATVAAGGERAPVRER